ncbi:hypothetical protein HYU06_03450 [Candidatus Woesearchaeota archaeon]|nr:hypothetical protein [Candidatus Woesearchaeota archaeon]
MNAKEAKQRIKEFLANPEQKSIEIELDPGVTDSQVYPRSALRYYFNWMLNRILGKVPPCKIKNSLYRMIGVKLGKEICLPMDVLFDYRYPDLVEVGDNTLIGGYTQIFAHMLREPYKEENKVNYFDKNRYASINRLNQTSHKTIDGKRILKLGRVKIGKDVLVASIADFEPGVTVGDNAIIGTATYVDKDVPELGFVGSRPMRLIKIVDAGWNTIDRTDTAAYYREQKEMTKKFLKDKTIPSLNITYKGKRGNAGNEWFRMRNTLKIWITAAWVEFTAFFPACGLKNLMLRLTGAKIGRNVRIEQFAYIDHINPDLITIEDNAVLKTGSFIGGHDFINNKSSLGRPVIGEGAIIKENAMIQCHYTNKATGQEERLVIGKHAIVGSWSFVDRPVPNDTIVSGWPAKPLAHTGESMKAVSEKVSEDKIAENRVAGHLHGGHEKHDAYHHSTAHSHEKK